MKNNKNMTDDEKIKIIINSLENMALCDIKKAIHGKCKMGAFILCSCLIDAIAGFIKGSDTRKPDYKNFVNDFLINYNGTKLYKDLRCKLVHSYSEGGTYLFTDNHSELHLKKDKSNKIIINLENFVDEIEEALNTFKKNILDKTKIIERENAINRFDNNGVIMVQPESSIAVLINKIAPGEPIEELPSETIATSGSLKIK